MVFHKTIIGFLTRAQPVGLFKPVAPKELKRQAIELPLKAGVVGAAFFPGVIAPIAKGALTFGKALVPKTILGKVTALSAGLLGFGLLKESPTARKKLLEEIPKAPGRAISLGKDIGGIIEGKPIVPPTIIEGLKKAGVVGATAALITGAVVAAKKVKARKEQIAISPTAPISLPPVRAARIIGAPAPTEAPPAPQMLPPIQNIIQIQNVI